MTGSSLSKDIYLTLLMGTSQIQNEVNFGTLNR